MVNMKIFQYGTFSNLGEVEEEVNKFIKNKDVVNVVTTSNFDDRIWDTQVQILVVYKEVKE